MDQLDQKADGYESGDGSTNAAFSGIWALQSLVKNSEQQGWLSQANTDVGAQHSIAVNCNSKISQYAGGMYQWQTDQYVNQYATAEYEYEKCVQAPTSAHLDKLKGFALSAKAQADAHDAIVTESEGLLLTAKKAAADAWAIVDALRTRLVNANATPTPVPTVSPTQAAHAAAPMMGNVADTATAVPSPTPSPVPSEASDSVSSAAEAQVTDEPDAQAPTPPPQ